MNILYLLPAYYQFPCATTARMHDLIYGLKKYSQSVSVTISAIKKIESIGQKSSIDLRDYVTGSIDYFTPIVRRNDIDIVHPIFENFLEISVPSLLNRIYNERRLVLGPNILSWSPLRSGPQFSNPSLEAKSYYYRKRVQFSDFFTPPLFSSPDRVFAFSDYHKSILTDMGIAKELIYTLPPFIRDDIFYPAKRQSRTTGLNLLFVGNTSPNKGIKIMINSLKMLISRGYSDVCLTVVGNNGSGVDCSGVSEHISFEEYKERKELGDYYRKADLFIHPSYEEAGPTTMIESLACGTPVICSDTESFRDYKQGRNALLFQRGNAEELANKIQMAADNLSELTENAQNTAHYYSVENHIDELTKVYMRTLDE